MLYRAGAVGVRTALWLVGVRWVVTGREHIQRHRAAVYCVNHSSNLEPPVLFLLFAPLFPRLRILYKAELRRLPILTAGFDRAGFVPIERGRRERAAAAIERAAQGLREGYSFLVFPEGTRSESGDLLPFKKGGFLMAIKAQAPIVPMAITGARTAMRRGSWVIRPATLHVRLGPPVETAGVRPAEAAALLARVRDAIAQLLGEARQPAEPSPVQPERVDSPRRRTPWLRFTGPR